ncbi:MAG: hypothetical protein WBR18_04205, partial [Anaerolineales bacterium]
MRSDGVDSDTVRNLDAAFGDRLQREAPLARYTSARIGGPADYLLVVRSADELADVSERLWSFGLRFRG